MIEFVQHGTTCELKGQLTQTEVVALWPQRQQLLEPQTEALCLKQLEYSDSAGAAFLLALVREHQGSLNLRFASAQLKKLINLYDLHPFFDEEAN